MYMSCTHACIYMRIKKQRHVEEDGKEEGCGEVAALVD